LSHVYSKLPASRSWLHHDYPKFPASKS
jgi:hypothetical protein